MSRSKKWRLEWAFFLGENGRRHYKLYVAMNLSFACSLRMGEILGLTWENVHISDEDIAADNAYVYIDKELTRASKRAIETLGEKELMTQDEIAVMDGGKCILQLRGVRPFFSDKFDITKHPKYKYLSDADPKNAFDMEKHIKRRPAIVKPDEVFDYYEIDVQEDAAP